MLDGSLAQGIINSYSFVIKIVLQLKIECRRHEVYLHVFHIAGTRMIITG
jgi:hypothetical protein